MEKMYFKSLLLDKLEVSYDSYNAVDKAAAIINALKMKCIDVEEIDEISVCDGYETLNTCLQENSLFYKDKPVKLIPVENLLVDLKTKSVNCMFIKMYINNNNDIIEADCINANCFSQFVNYLLKPIKTDSGVYKTIKEPFKGYKTYSSLSLDNAPAENKDFIVISYSYIENKPSRLFIKIYSKACKN